MEGRRRLPTPTMTRNGGSELDKHRGEVTREAVESIVGKTWKETCPDCGHKSVKCEQTIPMVSCRNQWCGWSPEEAQEYINNSDHNPN